jgi:ABC-type Na+ transport system ATPase subunit NatA
MSTFTPNELTLPVTPPAIEAAVLTNAYGEVEAVRGVSFTVARGAVVDFPGPNGAGRNTTINMLRTLARLTSGTTRVSGFDVARERDDVCRHIGLVETLRASAGTELAAAQSGTVAAAAGECDAPLIATVVMPVGGRL